MSHARVLAVVDLGRTGRAVARHAATLAGRDGARLALAHVVDWEAGADDFSPLTPAEVERRLAGVVSRRLTGLATELGRPDATPLVGWPGAGRDLAALIRGWQPDLAVVPAALDLVCDGRLAVPGWSCDAVAVANPLVRVWLERAVRLLDRPGRLAER